MNLSSAIKRAAKENFILTIQVWPPGSITRELIEVTLQDASLGFTVHSKATGNNISEALSRLTWRGQE